MFDPLIGSIFGQSQRGAGEMIKKLGESPVGRLLRHKPRHVALLPQPLQVVGRQDEHAVEPLPERERPVGQVLLAEERPRQQELVVLFPVPRKVVVSESRMNGMGE